MTSAWMLTYGTQQQAEFGGAWHQVPFKTRLTLLSKASVILGICVCLLSQLTHAQDKLSPAELFQKAESALQKGQLEAALEVLTSLESQLPASHQLEFFIGTLLAKYDHHQPSLKFFRKAIQLSSDFYPARYNAALVYLNLDQPAKAVEILEAASAKARQEGDFHNLLGNAYWKLGDVKNAAKELQNAYLLEPNNESFYLDAGSFFLQHNTPGPAIEIFSAALNKLPDSVHLRFSLGVAFLVSEKHAESQQHLRRVVEEHRDFLPAYFPLGFSYYYSGEYEKAEAFFRDAIRRAVDDYRAHYYLALALKNQAAKQDTNEISTLLRRSISLNPHNPDAHIELATFHHKRGEFKEAVNLLEQAVSLDPDSLPARRLLVIAYSRTGERDAGVRLTEELRRLEAAVQSAQGQEDDSKRFTLDYFVHQVNSKQAVATR